MAATLHTVRGSTSAVSGEFTMPAFPAPAGFEVRGKIIIAAKELDTGNKVRDRKMRSDSLDVERYPEIVFAPSRAVGTGVSLAPGTTVKLTLQGELTIRGVTRPLAVSVTASVKEKAIVADGSAHLSFLDFGVPDPSSFFLHVNPNLQVLLHLEARATSLP